jgi:uncharacterized protein Yka (UPF0111/DUF47 family)
MSDSETVVLADRLVSRTETYLDQTDACVALLPELLAAYPDGDYGEVVDRISTVESDCDRTNRRLCGLVADADVRDLGIRLTRVHLHASQTIELFNALEEVANATEQFAVDLDESAQTSRPAAANSSTRWRPRPPRRWRRCARQ